MLGAIIGVVSALFGMLVSYLTFIRKRDNEITSKAKKEGIIETKLNSIDSGIHDIRLDFKANEQQMILMNEKLIRVHESTKTAHKRIDNLIGGHTSGRNN